MGNALSTHRDVHHHPSSIHHRARHAVIGLGVFQTLLFLYACVSMYVQTSLRPPGHDAMSDDDDAPLQCLSRTKNWTMLLSPHMIGVVVFSLLVIFCESFSVWPQLTPRCRHRHAWCADADAHHQSSTISDCWTQKTTPVSNIVELSDCQRLDVSMRHSRRSILNVLAGCCVIPFCTSIQVGQAIENATVDADSSSMKQINNKPYAPLENLLPATRVKVLIDQAVETTAMLIEKHQSTGNTKDQQVLLEQLKSLLLEPHSFFKTRDEISTSRTYLDNDTWNEWKKARQQETQRNFQISVHPATGLNEALEQWGERRQFRRLRRQQLALEKSNNIRAAFNAYTNNLVFGESYILTASSEEKKRLIRQYNHLPDVTSVIRSDLDLRDLFRNQVLTSVDDAKAELEFQLNNGDADIMDLSELLAILREAQSSCNKWFEFVPENDFKKALAVVRSE
jgi:hypothetical protein